LNLDNPVLSFILSLVLEQNFGRQLAQTFCRTDAIPVTKLCQSTEGNLTPTRENLQSALSCWMHHQTPERRDIAPFKACSHATTEHNSTELASSVELFHSTSFEF